MYWNRVFESALVLAIVLQISTGLLLFRNTRLSAKTVFSKLQAYSGLYMACFLSLHATAILPVYRLQGKGLSFFVATGGRSGSLKDPLAVMFFVYYSLAVLAVSTHAGCALRSWLARKRCSLQAANRAACAIMAVGFVFFCAIVSAMVRFHLAP